VHVGRNDLDIDARDQDTQLRYAGEMAMRYPMVMVAGEITTQVRIDYEEVVRGVVGRIGCDSCLDDLLSVVRRCRVDRETKKGI